MVIPDKILLLKIAAVLTQTPTQNTGAEETMRAINEADTPGPSHSATIVNPPGSAQMKSLAPVGNTPGSSPAVVKNLHNPFEPKKDKILGNTVPGAPTTPSRGGPVGNRGTHGRLVNMGRTHTPSAGKTNPDGSRRRTMTTTLT